MSKISLESIEQLIYPAIKSFIIYNKYILSKNPIVNRLITVLILYKQGLIDSEDVKYVEHPNFNEYYVKSDQELLGEIKYKKINFNIFNKRINYVKTLLDNLVTKQLYPYKYHPFYDQITAVDRTPYPAYLQSSLYKSIKKYWDAIDDHSINNYKFTPLNWIREYEKYLDDQLNVKNGKYAIKTLQLQTFSSEGLFDPVWLTISSYLRGKLENVRPENAEFFDIYIENLKSLIFNSPSTDRDFIVYRGTGRGENWKVGNIINFPHFMSSTINKDIVLQRYIEDDSSDEEEYNIDGQEICCILTINIPKGSKLAWDRDELQVLFLPDSNFEITNITYEKFGKNTIRTLHSKYII